MFCLPTSIGVGWGGVTPARPIAENPYLLRPSRPERGHTLVTQRPKAAELINPTTCKMPVCLQTSSI